MKRTKLLWLGFAVVLLAAGGYFMFGPGSSSTDKAKQGRARANGPVPVVVAIVKEQAVPVTIRAVGNAQAYATVAIKSRVDGELMDVHFTDGQAVKKGERLYKIDPRPFQMQLTQATAVLARDRAQLENAHNDLKRTEELHRKGYAAQQQLDLARTTVAALEQTINTDQAAIDGVRLQLNYTEIDSPIDGRTADTQVDAGNLIKANDVPLVVINQTKPINVTFSVPEQYAFEIRQRMAKEKLEVEVAAPNVKRPVQKGVVTFINNAIDSTTGTVLVKATLANDDESLLPGQFVTVVLQLATIPSAIVIPAQALQTGQKGEYVFVVKPDMMVDLRPVTVGEATGSNVVIRSGLKAGEKVVTDGQLRLYPGARAAATEASKTPDKEASK
jgi:membrane fusion protein, multidrug efflux system